MKSLKINVSLLSSLFFSAVIFGTGTFLFADLCHAQNTIDEVGISPALDITRFAPYIFYATTTGTPSSVSAVIRGINGQISGEPMYNDYYVDGTPNAETTNAPMTYNGTSLRWETGNVYPDALYQEVYFANRQVTWYNTPSNAILQRNNYQLMHFTNPYTMVGDMSFFIELNAAARAANSTDLQVYLVSNGKTSAFFNTDWRNSADVELVGTISSTANVHHTHTANAAHYLVPLTANTDGTIGTKNLNVSGDFWIVLYTASPNNARGWNFRYHPACDDRDRWYAGSQTGWTTTLQTGCPDSHIHIARRDLVINDGVEAVVSAVFDGFGTVVSTETFNFAELPNLPPNGTLFTSPVAGGIYNGGGVNEIPVSWDPSTDPNGDTLLYSVYLLDESDNQIGTLVTNTSATSFTWDITSVNNGTYKLKGVITEDIPVNPLSTEFFMDGTFVISKAATTYQLSSVSIASNNIDPLWAIPGDIVTISFTSTGTITSPSVAIYSGGNPVTGAVTVTNTSGNDWTASYTAASADTKGIVAFAISASDLDRIYSDVTDSSMVTSSFASSSDAQEGQVQIDCPSSGIDGLSLALAPADVIFSNAQAPGSGNPAASSLDAAIAAMSDEVTIPDANVLTISDGRSGQTDGCPTITPGFTLTVSASNLTGPSGSTPIPASSLHILTTNRHALGGVANNTTNAPKYSAADSYGNRHDAAMNYGAASGFKTFSTYVTTGASLGTPRTLVTKATGTFGNVYVGTALAIVSGIAPTQMPGTYSGTITYTLSAT